MSARVASALKCSENMADDYSPKHHHHSISITDLSLADYLVDCEAADAAET